MSITQLFSLQQLYCTRRELSQLIYGRAVIAQIESFSVTKRGIARQLKKISVGNITGQCLRRAISIAIVRE